MNPDPAPGAPQPNVLRGIAFLLSATVVFALMDATLKYLARFYPVPGLVWARYAAHMGLMIVILGPRLRLDLVRTKQPGMQVLRAACLLGTTLFFVYALRYLPMAQALAISFIAPLLVTALSVKFLAERVAPMQWFAVAVGLAGVLIIVRPGGGVFGPAALLPLCGAVCFSFYQIITRRLAGRDNPFTTLFYTALVGALLMSAALPFAWVWPDPWHGVLLVCAGLLGGTGHFLLIKAFEQAPASALAPFGYAQLVWAVALGYLVFGDLPDAWALAGMGVIVASGLMVANYERVKLRRVTIRAGGARTDTRARTP